MIPSTASADDQPAHAITTTHRPPSTEVDTLRVVPWSDPIIDRQGHDPRSLYAERFWLGVLGPSAIWLLRHVAGRLDEAPEGADIDLLELARRLGIGHRGGRNSALSRTIGRCCEFRVARRVDGTTVAFRRRLPPVSLAQLQRLGGSVIEEHTRWARHHPVQRERFDDPARARRLADHLVHAGEGLHATAHLLAQYRVDPDLARAVAAEAWSNRDRVGAR